MHPEINVGRETAKRMTGAVVRAPRDRLTREEAEQATAELPRELQEIWPRAGRGLRGAPLGRIVEDRDHGAAVVRQDQAGRRVAGFCRSTAEGRRMRENATRQRAGPDAVEGGVLAIVQALVIELGGRSPTAVTRHARLIVASRFQGLPGGPRRQYRRARRTRGALPSLCRSRLRGVGAHTFARLC